MMHCCDRIVRHVLAVVLLVAVGAIALPGGDAFAQPGGELSSRTDVAPADARRLAATLEDPAARARLVAQLKLLAQADQQTRPSESDGLLTLVSNQIASVSEVVLSAATSLADVGHLVSWIRQQIADPALRAHWSDILGKLAGIVLGGFAVEQVVVFLLARPVRLLSQRHPSTRLARVPVAVAIWSLQMIPAAVFFVVAQALRGVPLLHMASAGDAAAQLVTLAYALQRLALVSEQALLVPGLPHLRVPVLDDETANYLFIWARRLTLTGVWGYIVVQALRLLGLPRPAYLFSLKMLGLLLTTLVIILVLQNRQTVAAWIRERGKGRPLNGAIKRLRDRLANFWHVLAVLYILALFFIWAFQVKGGFEYVVRASVLTLVVLVAANLLSGVLKRLVERAFAISADLRSRFPHLEARANRYMAIMQNVLRGVLFLVTALALAQVWGADVLAWMAGDVGRKLLSGLVSIAAVLIGALVVWELVNSAIERYLSRTDDDGNLLERGARARTLLPLLRNVVLVVLVVVVALIVLSEIGVNIAPLLAGAGVVGVAIGFGSQKLVQDVITGAFILFEDTIAVGDVVKIGDHSGVVEGLTIRTMRLRDLSGNVHTLPFSSVGTITNMTRDFAYHVFDVGVAYREDAQQVMGVLKQLGDELCEDPTFGPDIVEPIEVFGIEKLDDSAVVVRGRIKTRPGKQWSMGREFNRRVKERFDALGIEIPFPHTTLYFGIDKDGYAPAANVRLVRERERAVPKAPVVPFKGDVVDFPDEGAPAGETPEGR